MRGGAPIGEEVSAQINTFIAMELTEACKLNAPRQQKLFLSADDLCELASAFFDPKYPATTTRNRFRNLLWLDITWSETLRGGALVPDLRRDESKRALLWSDLQLVVLRDQLAGANRLLLHVTVPNGKTDMSKNAELMPQGQEGPLGRTRSSSRWSSPVTSTRSLPTTPCSSSLTPLSLMVVLPIVSKLPSEADRSPSSCPSGHQTRLPPQTTSPTCFETNPA